MIIEKLVSEKKQVEVPVFTIQHKMDNKTPKDFHSHRGYEMVWVRSGEAQFIFEEKVFHLKKGHVLLFNSSELHKVRLPDKQTYDRVMLMFHDDLFSYEQPIFQEFKRLLDQQPTPHFFLQIEERGYENFYHIIRQLLQEDMSPDKWQHQHALILYVSELLLFFSRAIHTSMDHIFHISNSNPVRTQERILKEINSLWNTNWQLEDLAEKLHFNKYYLCHFFKKEFGVTIHQYILQRRMYEAKKLLVETSMPIAEIAFRIGFSTASNFIRCFKKYQHETPKQYRNQA
ncbi:AraC-type DNA-binding protein [Gracilibacillus orientalis]|uniref:AraC-type DNA-binding protein n=1 Tax=Gracilibacillus orientalis TaxID=334253 RepID=A0A1I4HMV6_9BACI|nr:AraC family transcriptional regulator [Gracilibacillus orientalis]SFL43464.1 AraC-type DNA-binding protein [Gracilibacillus orientalis]